MDAGDATRSAGDAKRTGVVISADATGKIVRVGSGIGFLARAATDSDDSCASSVDVRIEAGGFRSGRGSNVGKLSSGDRNDHVTGKEKRTSCWEPDSGDCGNAAE